MSTAIMENTTRRVSEAFGETHRALTGKSPEERQQIWTDYITSLSNFDVTNPNDVIQAKATLDTLEQVLFASATVSGP